MTQKGMVIGLVLRIARLCVAALVCITAASAFAQGVRGTKPNIIIILTDDLGYSDVSLYGRVGDVRTPNIDRIGKEGVIFPDMRANCTVCSPSRAALMTGKFPDRVGVPGVIRTETDNTWGYLSPSVPTLADHLKKAGYHTALIGKWHLGLEEPNVPNSRGFDFFHGFLGDMMDSYTTHLRHGQNYLRKNRDVIDPPGHATDLFTGWACDYIRERAAAKTPFFLYLAYNAPHCPIEPPPGWLARVKERDPSLTPKRAALVALIEHLDDGIGKVLDALDANGLARDTLIAFSSDNGGALPFESNNSPWRGGKEDHYDGGLRVPFALRWPAKVNPGAHCAYTGLVFDLFPTALELAGLTLPADLDARSLVPALEGRAIETPQRELYFVRREGGARYVGKSYEAIIQGDWKLMQNDPFSPLQLFNLADDPQEKSDLAKQDPKRVRDMSHALRAHIQNGGSAPWAKP